MTPSQLPSISFLPTISDVPTIEPCIDFDGWVDTFEDNCTWYAEYDEPGCPLYGNSFASLSGVNEDLSASDACCKLTYILIKIVDLTLRFNSSLILFLNFVRLLWRWGTNLQKRQ